MAKSMRSKFKRKMRALKREKYSAREMEKLKKTTARIQLSTLNDDGIDIKKEEIAVDELLEGTTVEEEPMVLEDLSTPAPAPRTSSRNLKKGLKNEHGNYPAWMTQRKVKQIKRCGKGSKGPKGSSKSKGKSSQGRKLK